MRSQSSFIYRRTRFTIDTTKSPQKCEMMMMMMMTEWLTCASSLSNICGHDLTFCVFVLSNRINVVPGWKETLKPDCGTLNATCPMPEALSKTEFICAEVHCVQRFSFIITPYSVYTLITRRPGSFTFILLFGFTIISEDFDT